MGVSRRRISGVEQRKRTVDVPVLLLSLFLEVRGEEDVLGIDSFQLLTHLLGRTEEINVLVDHIGRVLVFLAAGEGVNGLPFLRALRELFDNLSTENT